MVNDGKDDFNVYQFDTKEPKIDKKKLTFIILIILGIICILLICNNISNTMRSYQVYKQYEAQILTLNQQEVERKQQEEAKKEQERQAKLPKYTETGKNSIVVLMHDSPAKSVTADTLPQIIATLRDKGYEFKNFYEIIK